MTGNDDPRPVPFATTSLPGSDFAIFSRPPPLSHPSPVADATSNFRYGVPPIHLPSCRRLSSLVRYKVTIRPSSSTWRAFSRSIPTPTPPSFSDTTCFLIFLFLFFSSNARDRVKTHRVIFTDKDLSHLTVTSSFSFSSSREMSEIDRYILLNWA